MHLRVKPCLLHLTEYDGKGGLFTKVNHLEGGIPHGAANCIHPKTRKKPAVYYFYGQIVDAK
jgi:hypothetical protein